MIGTMIHPSPLFPAPPWPSWGVAAGESISPSSATLAPLATVQFTATGFSGTVTWSVVGGDAHGTITSGGLYSAPETPGSYTVSATAGASTATAAVTVEAVEVVSPAGLDHDIVEDIIDRLRATTLFDEVIGYETDGFPASSEWYAMARVTLGDVQSEVDIDAETVEVRRAFHLMLCARDQDPTTRDRLLAVLCNAARNALLHKSLADVTLPPLTQLRRPARPTIAHPEASTTIDGEFTYLVPEEAGWSEGDD